MNHAIRWLYSNIAGRYVREGKDTCMVCGLPTDGGLPPKAVFRRTFTNQDILAARESYIVCEACAWYFDHQELRRQHWYITAKEARSLSKKDIFPLLMRHIITPPSEDRYYLIALSKKKHVALRARLNATGCRSLRVNFEEMVVDVDERFINLERDIVQMRRYHRWDEIENDAYLPYALLRWPSIGEFEATRESLRPWLRSPQYRLARYLYSPDLEEVLCEHQLP